MANLRKFLLASEKYSGSVDFLVVYIEEAHPAELEEIAGNHEIRTHASLENRVDAANKLVELFDGEFPCPLVCDLMSDEANAAYGALPERVYVIQNGVVKFQGGVGPHEYDLEAGLDFMRSLI